MASTSSIGGLISGLDTTTLISQLMQVAAAPQTRLKTTLSTTNARITAAQGINAKAASMTTLAADLAKATTYTTAAAKSSSTAVSATVTGTPAATSLTFSVTQLASAYSVASGHLPATTTGATTFAITSHDGTAHSVTADSNSPADLVKAINASDAGVSATSITDSTGSRLVLTSKTTGATTDFTISGLSTTDADVTLRTGSDAVVDLGGGITVSSATGTFTNLIDGVSVTPSALADGVTVSTAVDTNSISSKVSSLVASMNAVLSDVSFHTKAPAAGTTASATTGGLLAGNGTMRELSNQILDTVSSNAGADSAALAGLEVTRDGQVTFDATKFNTLYTNNPAQAQAVLTAFGTAVQGVGKAASDKGSGTVTAFITGSQSTAKTLTDRISDWNVRLSAKQSTLTAQYTALETSLSKLKSQSDSLTQALASLTSSSK